MERMTDLSSLAGIALTESHTMDVRATATTALGLVEVPIVDGEVTADSGSQVRRTASVVVGLDMNAWPLDALDTLSPLGSELFIEYGIVLGDQTEWLPLIRGPITSVTRTQPVHSAGDAVRLEVSDRSALVAQARFDAPAQTVAGAMVVDEITRLITEAIPGAVVVDYTGNNKVSPRMEMERERWNDGVEKLADSIGAEVFCDQRGTFVIRNEPDVTDTPRWRFDASDHGILMSEQDEWSRDLTYNRVVAMGERTDGIPPVRAVASDTNPSSPTYIGGPFGIKTRFYASQLLTTVAQCQATADSFLKRVTGRHMTVQVEALVNPGLDAGDVVVIDTGHMTPGLAHAHIIDSITFPLTPGGTQRITTRAPALPEESGG